jgi:DNA invertase Pin-like site-specific DNA recombinase
MADMQRPTVLNVIEMLRVSSDRQDVQRQEYDTADNREQHGLNALRAIRIKISGTLVMTHPEVQLMLEQLSDPNVHGISVSAIDRVFRPRDYNLEILKFFDENRKVIVSTKEGIVEPWTDRGWDICMGAAQKAGAELRELKRRTKGGRRKAHAENKPMNTCAPYGILYLDKYSRDAEGKCQYFIEDPALASNGMTRRAVVQMIFEWRVVHKMRTGSIQTKLNKMGILTAGKKGQFEPGLWSRQTVRQLLMNEKYCGEVWEGGKLLGTPCPKFIERDVFDAAQAIFASEKEMSNGKPATAHLLCGWLRCKTCRRRHRTVTANGGRKGHAYVCGNYDYRAKVQVCKAASRIKCGTLEDWVFKTIWAHITSADLLLANAKAYYDGLPSSSSTAKLEKELAAIRSRIQKTRNLVKAGAEDEATGTAEILVALQEVKAIEAELRAAGSVVTLPPAHLVQAGCNLILGDGGEPETFEERRPVLEALLDLKVFYGDGEVEITGRVPIPERLAALGGKESKCNGGFSDAYTSSLYIPFKIKGRVA